MLFEFIKGDELIRANVQSGLYLFIPCYADKSILIVILPQLELQYGSVYRPLIHRLQPQPVNQTQTK